MKKSTILLLFVSSLLTFQACTDTATTTDPKTVPGVAKTGNPVIDALSQKILENPNDNDLLMKRAELFYEYEGFDEALADVAKVLQTDSINVDALHLLANVYMDYNRSRQGLLTMEKAASLYPERIPTLLKLSEFQLILKQHSESLATIDKVLRLNPRNADAFMMLGMNFESKGEISRAINSYQKAVENDPDKADIWMKLGTLLAQEEKPIAITYFDNAIRADATNPDYPYAKGQYLHNKNQLDAALEMYSAATKLDPDYSEAYFSTGIIHLERQEWEKAADLFNIATQTDPMHVRAYYYKGYVAEATGNKTAAKNHYEQALKLAPGYAKAEEGLLRLRSVN